MKTVKLQLLLILAGFLNFNSYAQSSITNCTPSPSGIISWWPAEGNTEDIAYSNNGTLMGSVTYANGEVGQAFNFNGGDYVQIANSPSLNPSGSFSIEGWIYPTQDAEQKIISKWGDQGSYGAQRSYNLSTVTGYGLALNICDQANQNGGNWSQAFSILHVLTPNAWNHVAGTYNSATGIRVLYVDGVKLGTFTNPPVVVYNSITPVTIGAWLRAPGTVQDYFQGKIDELSFYNRALSDSEIQAIYSAGSAGKCSVPPYVQPPRPATGTATLAGAFVVGVTITDGGAGYTNTPSIRFIGGGGSGAQASVVVSNGVVVIVNVINAGSGYTNAPVVVFDPPFIPNPVLGIASASILTFSNLMVGSSYQLQQFQSTIWVNQGGTLTASNIIYSQVVSGIPDSASYRLALTPIPQQATAVSQVFNGFVVGVQITARGSGYVTSPTVTFAGNGNVGSNAMAVASIYNGAVTNITVINAGIGYVAPVTVQIDPPPVTALSPKVTPGALINSSSLAPYENYQIQFRTDFGSTWGNLSGGMFTPTAATNAQYVFLTNYTAFFRLQYLP